MKPLGLSLSPDFFALGTVGAVRVMRVEYDHYSKMCRSNKIPPMAFKDHATYIEQVSFSRLQ